MPQIVWITGPDGRNIYVNQQWLDYTGLSLEESVGDGWTQPFLPEDRERAWGAWQHAMATIGTYSIESRLRRADGVYRWWLVRGVPVQDTRGTILKWFGTCTDVHDLKVAELEISRINRALKMLSSCNEALIRAKGESDLLNEVCKVVVGVGGYRMAWIGYTKDDEAQSVTPMAHAGVEEGYLAEVKVTWNQNEPLGRGPVGQAIRSNTAVVHDDVAVDSEFAPWLPFAQARGYRGNICLPLRDATHTFGVLGLYSAGVSQTSAEELRLLQQMADDLAFGIGSVRADADRGHLEAQLAQSQKMEAIGQLAGGIAHDFNNLLTVIGGRSSLLLMKMRPDDPARKEVDLIQSTAQRAAGLTRQLLAFSRKQVLEPKPVNLQALVDGVTPMLRRLIGEHIEVVIVSGHDLGQIMADPGQMEQVVVNLVVNARDAMPDGGTLTIETSNRTVQEAGLPAPNRPVPPGPYVTLSVVDTGYGMDPVTVTRIFEPFFTTKEHGKGTGLGLSTVHGIVNQSGGYLAVESAVGRGTTFTISLPRILDPVDVARVPQEPLRDLLAGSGTVLLVEDDEELRRLASEILRTCGYTVLDTGDPLEALTICDRQERVVDLLLTDMVMPAMRGTELAARLRESRPGLKMLFMSGYADETGDPSRAGGPARPFLQKPFTPHDLTRTVREALAEKRAEALLP
jgi:PAS domain S-box-containing protein